MQDLSLHVGTFTRSILIALATEDGSLTRARIALRESSVTSSPAQFESLESGEFDLVFTSPDNVLAYRFLTKNPLGRNLPVEILSAIDRGLGLSLCLGPAFHSVEEVRDNKVGVDVPQSGFAFIAYELLQRAGLRPGDYVIETLGSTPKRASALIAGECAATVLNAGNELRAAGADCSIVSSVTDIGPYLGTVVAALGSDDPAVDEARRRFLDVMLSTATSVVEGSRESDVVGAAMSLLNLTEDEAHAHYRCLIDPTRGLIPDGIVDASSIATLVALRQEFAPTLELNSIVESLEEFVDVRSLR
jgi:ABC-type nitrate/sulfonate/bicarbonate transport system substrate-binding protein